MTEHAAKPSEEQKSKAQSTLASAEDGAKSLLSKAQGAVGGAVDTTVGAVKDHPVAAAAIAGGVAAAAAGAAYGISKLGGKEPAKPDAKATKPKP